MCGIAGFIGSVEVPASRIQAALAAMGHRGPNHAGHRHWETAAGAHVHLLHTRLSIIDLDPRANQPLGRHGKWLALNGEIYNYRELRRELEARGVNFTTTSDTEVLVEVLARSGWDGLDQCEGMWAFALFDEQTGELGLCRDRFGEKPLYLMQAHGGTYFASETNTLFALAGYRPAPNLHHLRRYLVHGYKALYKYPDSFYQQVVELSRATLRRFAADGRCLGDTSYWKFRHCPDESMTFEQAVEGVRARLIHAMELRLRADVPLAFCMSSGVDSNALISIAKRCFNHDVYGFTITSADPRYDEVELTRRSARELGVHLTEVPLDQKNFLTRLERLIHRHDAPIYTLSYYVHSLLLNRIADQGYRISISGTAADELFSGYYDHHLLYLATMKAKSGHAQAQAAWERHVKPIVRNPFLQDPDTFVKNPGQREHIFLKEDEFRAFLTEDFVEAFTEETYTPALMRNRMLNELFHESVPQILHEDDLNAMAVSVENRSPFLDRSLFEFALTIPERLLVRDGRAKAILREAVRGIAPDCVVDERRKVGFNAPILELLDLDDPEVMDRLLEDSPIFQILRRDRVTDMLTKRSFPNSDSKFLFSFVCAKLFLEAAG